MKSDGRQIIKKKKILNSPSNSVNTMADTNELCFQILNSPMKSVNTVSKNNWLVWMKLFEERDLNLNF